MGGYSEMWFRLPADYLNLKTHRGFLARIERAGESNKKGICDCSPINLAITGEWLAIGQGLGSTDEAGPILKSISEETQLDAIYFSGSTVSGSMDYCRWHAGKLARALELQSTADSQLIWRVVEGEPEPWERDLFFPEEKFGYWLNEGHEGTEADKLALQECWTAGRIIQGLTKPVIGMTTGELFDEIVIRNNLPTCEGLWRRPEKLRGT